MTNTNITTTSWTVAIEEDPVTGDLLLPLPAELLELQGWNDGDELEWRQDENGHWTLKKYD